MATNVEMLIDDQFRSEATNRQRKGAPVTPTYFARRELDGLVEVRHTLLHLSVVTVEPTRRTAD